MQVDGEGGSLQGATSTNAPRELCTPKLRAEPSPKARYHQRVPAPCAGTEHRSLSLNGHQPPLPPPCCRTRWGICNARSGYVAAAAVIMK